MQAQPFVPAWKRLGLQLKRPNNDGQTQAEPAPKRLKSDIPNGEVAKQKNKPNGHLNGDSLHASIGFQESISGPVQTSSAKLDQGRKSSRTNEEKTQNVAQSSSTQEPSKPSEALRKKRKSVSFAPSTKPDESESETHREPTTADPAPAPPKPPIDHNVAAHQAEKRAKRAARQKHKRTAPLPAEPSDIPEAPTDTSKPYLNYLHDYHYSKDAWKFNKSQQTQLLKNTFNLHRIPASYSPALSSYIQGLKGKAARERLEKDAREIVDQPVTPESADQDMIPATPYLPATKVTTIENKASDERKEAEKRDLRIVKQVHRDQALKSEEASEEYRFKRLNRQRAEAILAALAASAPAEPDASSEANQAAVTNGGDAERAQPRQNGQKQNNPKRSRGRKRRTRTGVPDDDDVSSVSSDSDD